MAILDDLRVTFIHLHLILSLYLSYEYFAFNLIPIIRSINTLQNLGWVKLLTTLEKLTRVQKWIRITYWMDGGIFH